MRSNNTLNSSFLLDKNTIFKINVANKLLGKRQFYIQNYKEYYLENLRDEYNSLHSMFPDVQIIPEARIKSLSSYNNKVYKILESNNYKDIYDIFGNRYIVVSSNGSKDEEDIISTLYQIKDYLAFGYSKSENISERVKDYVLHPRHTSYQSLHISRIHYINSATSYLSETQLRSFSMDYNANFGTASHANSYKKRIPGVTEVPNKLKYIFDDNGKCLEVKEMSKEEAFEKFFGIQFDPCFFPNLDNKNK